jgi:pyruvate/2-oxoglutarate dehydrogenase complex dihydrolipoamide dehydrogenase (E3) component
MIFKEIDNMKDVGAICHYLTYFQDRAEFVDDYILAVGGKTITAPQIVIATGARSLVPPIPGLLEAGFLDNVSRCRQAHVPAYGQLRV